VVKPAPRVRYPRRGGADYIPPPRVEFVRAELAAEEKFFGRYRRGFMRAPFSLQP
jgi:hypothetical protein